MFFRRFKQKRLKIVHKIQKNPQIYWYTDILVSFSYTNFHACTHTYAHMKWVRLVLKLSKTAAKLFKSQRQPYSLQK